MLSKDEYTITAGRIDFIDPLDDGEHVTLFLKGVAGGAAQDLAASPALDLPTQPATDLLLIVRSGTVYTAPLAALAAIPAEGPPGFYSIQTAYTGPVFVQELPASGAPRIHRSVLS